MGLNRFLDDLPSKQDREKGTDKKIPSLRIARLGMIPACTLHSLILEDLEMKDIQAGFLTLPALTCLPTSGH